MSVKELRRIEALSSSECGKLNYAQVSKLLKVSMRWTRRLKIAINRMTEAAQRIAGEENVKYAKIGSNQNTGNASREYIERLTSVRRS